MAALLPTRRVIEAPITALPFSVQLLTMLRWARDRESRMVCLANVHMLMEAHSRPEFASMLEYADLVTPDGMPLVWLMRWMGVRDQERVPGIDVLTGLCQLAALQKTRVFFLGSQMSILHRMRIKLKRDFPGLQIAEMLPLPFRPLTPAEDKVLIQRIHESGASLVLVSLGCPKQEQWIAQHKGKVRAVMVGLGGAFPVYAGLQKRAPDWMRSLGLEWAYRLIQEPRRLWRRYWKTNGAFIWLALRKLLLSKQKTWMEPVLPTSRSNS